MDLAYDHLQDETYGKDAVDPNQNSSLNADLQDAYKAITTSPWGVRLGGFLGTVKKQARQRLSFFQSLHADSARANLYTPRRRKSWHRHRRNWPRLARMPPRASLTYESPSLTARDRFPSTRLPRTVARTQRTTKPRRPRQRLPPRKKRLRNPATYSPSCEPRLPSA
jgi:hypothetical protein